MAIRVTCCVMGLLLLYVPPAVAQYPPDGDQRLYDIIEAASAQRIEHDIRVLAGFGTRNTLSDTTSTTRGIGAARRWIFEEFKRISADCNGCLEVSYQRTLVSAADNERIPEDVYVVNVIAVQRGTTHPNRYVVMSGDIDSRASRGSDGVTDAPGANDNASGMAGTLEAARLLTKYSFGSSVVYAGLSGEEQGLFGGRHLAEKTKTEGWDIAAVLNNDMIGNIEGIDGVVDNTTFRIFSQAMPVATDERALRRIRVYGGEVDGPSRQVARYVARMTDKYFTNLRAKMIYRLDRFGRGGHHRPFNDAGFPGVRIMETHENYVRQHQDIRTEDGIKYGDVVEGVNFEYAARLTGVNAISLAGMAWAPPTPGSIRIGGAVRASARMAWSDVEDPGLLGYKVYWRETTEPQWTSSRFVGTNTEYTFENLVIDNYLFGVAAVGVDGNESVVGFPDSVMR
ncbi:MAG: M28 family peptidase [Rhodothermales bacterium]|nr:M28 family peptidase [Rhodothermales bacterium]